MSFSRGREGIGAWFVPPQVWFWLRCPVLPGPGRLTGALEWETVLAAATGTLRPTVPGGAGNPGL